MHRTFVANFVEEEIDKVRDKVHDKGWVAGSSPPGT
jgi:hypothetical protein